MTEHRASTSLPADDDAADTPDEHVTYLLAKAAHVLERTLDAAMVQHGLTLRQFSALIHISTTPGLSSADLARLLLTSAQATHTLVQRLLAAGLVERASGASRQPRALTLSRTGEDVLQRAAATATATEKAALSVLSAGELDTIRRSMIALVAAHQSR